MHKFRFFLDFEKEEKWLEQMAKEGYHLKGIFLGYQFQKGTPENATIKVDFRRFKRKDDFIDYCTLFEDSGWKHLTGSRHKGMQYFKKMNETSDDDIFSDQHSKAGRYKRYANMFFELAISYLPLLVAFYLTDIINFEAFLNPKELYFTPGLWDKAGAAFWSSFLFETPFALMRGLAWSFIPIMIILYILFGYKSKKLYEEQIGE